MHVFNSRPVLLFAIVLATAALLSIASGKLSAQGTGVAYEELPAHYIILLDISGSMRKFSHDVGPILSERIPELIKNPDRFGIKLPPFRPGFDYVSLLLFGIPQDNLHFDAVLHPKSIFWQDSKQFEILGSRIAPTLQFNMHFSAISIAIPLSLEVIRDTLTNPALQETLVDRRLAKNPPRFSRTVGIIVTDAMYNLEGSSVDELTYLSQAGSVGGQQETRERIARVRRFYDYDLNVSTFFKEGSSKKLLIGIREFVPKTIALSSLVMKISDINLKRYAPSMGELFYRGSLPLNFIKSDDSPFLYYKLRSLYYKYDFNNQYKQATLEPREIRKGIDIDFPKISTDQEPDTPHFLDLAFSYDLDDPVYGLNSIVFHDRVTLRPETMLYLPFPGKWPISDWYLRWLPPVTAEGVQTLFFWVMIGFAGLFAAGVVLRVVTPPLEVGVSEAGGTPEPIIINFNSKMGRNLTVVKAFRVHNRGGRRFGLSRRMPLELEVVLLQGDERLSIRGNFLGLSTHMYPRIAMLCSDGQEIPVMCNPMSIADYLDVVDPSQLSWDDREPEAYKEVELKYVMKVWQVRRSFRRSDKKAARQPQGFWKKRTVYLPELDQPLSVKMHLIPERTEPQLKLTLEEKYLDGERLEHHVDADPPGVARVTVTSSAQHQWSYPISAQYVVLTRLSEDQLQPAENGHVIVGEFSGRTDKLAQFLDSPSMFKVTCLGYEEQAIVPLLADFTRIPNPPIKADSYEIWVCPFEHRDEQVEL
ncbi:MAG: hypothetical protein ACYC6G_18435 [Desulfobaccales bacterium]